MHPALLVPEIREHIFQFCSKKDLKACRLVSRSWRDSSVKELSSKTKIKLGDGPKMSQFLNHVKATGTNNKLYTNFSLSYSPTEHKMAKTLWRICGENVKTLELVRCQFQTTRHVRAVLFRLCPNMEKLSMEDVSIAWVNGRIAFEEPTKWTEPIFGAHTKLQSLTVDNKASKNTGVTWMEYFSHFSSIEVLRTQRDKYVDQDMFRAVSRVRAHNPKKLALKHIRICCRSLRTGSPMNPEPILTVLRDPSLHFKSVILCLSSKIARKINARHAKLADILSVHRESLKTLELNCSFRNPDCLSRAFSATLDQFPENFENLTQVTFFTPSIPSLNFVKFTPNLKTLLVKWDVRWAYADIIKNTHVDQLIDHPLTRLEKLELNFDEVVGDKEFQLLATLMPNVKRLKMPLYNWLFESVCERWKGLVALEIVRGTVDQYGITGLLKSQMDRIVSCCDSPPETTGPRANITYLKELRTLSLQGPSEFSAFVWRFEKRLSHWAAHLGIEQLPQLKRLRLCGYELDSTCGIWKNLLERYPWPKYGTRW